MPMTTIMTAIATITTATTANLTSSSEFAGTVVDLGAVTIIV